MLFISIAAWLLVTQGEPDYSYAAIEKWIQEWKALHVQGILLDCAGPSYGTNEARRVWAMNAVHRAGMTVLMNAFNPSALFALHPHKGDAWLAENWVISNGKSTGNQGQEWWATPKMKQRGWQIWATATGQHFLPTRPLSRIGRYRQLRKYILSCSPYRDPIMPV